jgi:hypothetical protein
MKKLVVTLAAAAIGAGVAVPSAVALPTGAPGDPTCQASIISPSVQEFTGRRAVADFFFPDSGPKAVQTAERFVQEFCAG